MAISIDFNTKVIFIPKSFLTPISPPDIYQLDVNAFRIALKQLEETVGITYPDTHNNYSPVTLSGVTYARIVEIINGYTVEIENGQYTVQCTNANHNLADVKTQNSVSLIVNNSGGLIDTGGGVFPTAGQIADAVWADASGLLVVERLSEAWGRLGLDPAAPLVTNNTQITFGTIVMALLEAPAGTITLTRQP